MRLSFATKPPVFEPLSTTLRSDRANATVGR
jgi:hypothetical protein